MSATEAQLQAASRPKLLFVDDEQRVLNSMRIMFRRKFDLFLASHGAEALDIVKGEDIDVIIADHRMPQMTGVEVLTAVRTLSPRTVRILLTGYADLDAVEGSINDSEVFRFLTKPCAPQQLRETIELAAKVARETPATVERDLSAETLEIILESDTFREIGAEAPEAEAPRGASVPSPAAPAPTAPAPQHPAAPAPAAPAPQHPAAAEAPREPADTDVIEQPCFAPEQTAVIPRTERPAAANERLATGLGVVVFSNEEDIVQTVMHAVRGRLPVYQATNIVQVVKVLTEDRPGVLVTDISEDRATIQSMTARLKEHLPELVTIAVSQHRDVLDMVWLINHGQIFRFLRKPLSPGRCAVSLQAALQHHRMLLKHPELVKRHEVDGTEEAGLVDSMLEKLKSVKRLWASV
jgi:DNA-binding NtrC family response regulator